MLKQIIKAICCLFVLLLALIEVRAQEIPSLSGLVLDKDNGSRIEDVNVVNLRTKTRAVTNSYGVFYIEAAVGDTLSLTKTGYGSIKTFVYTMEDMLLEMQSGIHLETIIVSRRSREQQMEDILRDYGKKGIYNGGKNSVGTYVASPATALYNLFGREAKNMKRFEKFMDREVDEIQVDRIFSKAKIAEITGLSGDDLQNFMDLYRPSLSMAQNWGQYDLLDYVNRSLKSWNEQGRPASQKLPKLYIPPQSK
ncbi:hypothetical protein FAZ19_02970 [Sphingobacterium alkalisoli]|uniref:Carboxypeptidase-like regulatory domain-containing protein n=1 Tax=Sphingobacterium alkalisoli TaxID=1874115 RepID=A0A4U0H8N7_9SPHI|nr:hypothetical protein [Sphingobacterium alkalisoli]TJY68233.1 hypothetical protein FAZ19_02970 [Sphingobacterium alkalisoli]GGH08027.1 hypothetical protein GCM10011418_05370 [Sphingobacterium alkalisoli]